MGLGLSRDSGRPENTAASLPGLLADSHLKAKDGLGLSRDSGRPGNRAASLPGLLADSHLKGKDATAWEE